MSKCILFIISFLITISSFSNFNKDSLLQVVDRGTDEEKIIVYLRLSSLYRNNLPDSSMHFATKAHKLAVDNNFEELLLSTYNDLAINYKLRGENDTVIYFFNKCLDLSVKQKDSTGISSAYNNLGVYYDDVGEQAKALEYFIKSAEIAESRDDKEDIALSYNNIGLIHYKLEDLTKAKDYYEKSLKLREELNDMDGVALLYNNIGILYYYEDKPQDCIDYFKKALSIYKESNNIRQSAMVLSNIGELYYEIGIYQASMNYLIESLNSYQSLKDKSGELYSLNILGQVYHEWGYDKKAIDSYLKAYGMALELDAKYDLQNITYNLFELYQKNKNFELSNQYLALYVDYKDSLLNIEKDKTIQKLNTQYETEKKKQEIEILNNKDKLNTAIINKQKTFNIALIIGVFLILIVVVLIIRQNKIRRKSNELLKVKNEEIVLQKEQILETNEELHQQNEEILAQRDEIEAQRDMVHDQKIKIEQIHKHVSHSIDYAKRIQSSTLPSNTLLKKYFSDQLVYFKPRDIVSGDFYWWSHVEDHTVITAADCTGHGVPGAFMSMLGMSLLKEIVIKEYVTHPGVILRKIRKEIIHTLKQKGNVGEQQDGMDMALISVNHKTGLVQYAGANNPLYIIKDRELKVISEKNNAIQKIDSSEFNSDSSKFFYEIKPDKMPISIYEKMDRFVMQEFELEKGDQIYMFSDGYPDQFGGPKDKKFKYKPFKKLLFENANLPMAEQKKVLDKTLKLWMKGTEQIDDIVVLGLKI